MAIRLFRRPLHKIFILLVTTVALLVAEWLLFTTDGLRFRGINSVLLIHPYKYSNFNETFLVNMPSCKIINIDAFDPTVSKFDRYSGSERCQGKTNVVFQDGLNLTINWTAVEILPKQRRLKYCHIIPFYKPKNISKDHNFIQYNTVVSTFKTTVKIEHEFVQVICLNNRKKRVYVNYYAFIIPEKPSRHTTTATVISPTSPENTSPSILLVMIDSVSRLSFIRQMRQTRAFIENELHAFNMMGYNKVADNTFVNIVPMTLGKFIEETLWNKSQTFDNFDFIWKQYSRKGYKTAFVEDAPKISTFDYIKKGFSIPPADHFYRPISIAMSKEEEYWTNNLCYLDRLEAEIMLNYTLDFVQAYSKLPVFGFLTLSKVTHDNPNGGSKIDETFYNFFQKLNATENFKNMFIFFFSDHGMRYGQIRNTYIGKLEERLPFMYLILPNWFRKQYPNIANIVRENQRRLSTPFDVYETLQNILQWGEPYPHSYKNTRGVSWLTEIPLNRSCQSAGIKPHWCTCLERQTLDPNDQTSTKASQIVVSFINDMLKNQSRLCATLMLKKTHLVERLFQSDHVVLGAKDEGALDRNEIIKRRKETFDTLQITLETVPGNAIFEATVRVDLNSDNYKLQGEVSRLNLYGTTSSCVNDSELRKFCFCNKLLRKIKL